MDVVAIYCSPESVGNRNDQDGPCRSRLHAGGGGATKSRGRKGEGDDRQDQVAHWLVMQKEGGCGHGRGRFFRRKAALVDYANVGRSVGWGTGAVARPTGASAAMRAGAASWAMLLGLGRSA